VATGAELYTSTDLRGGPESVALSGDGRKAVLAGRMFISIWDLDRFKEVDRPQLFWETTAVAISANGRIILAGSKNGEVTALDLQTQRQIRLVKHSEPYRPKIRAVALSADGHLGICGTGSRLIVVDIAQERVLHELYGHVEWINDVALSADASVAVSASDDGTLRVWDPIGGKELRRIYANDEARYRIETRAERFKYSYERRSWRLGQESAFDREFEMSRIREGMLDRANGFGAVATDGSGSIAAAIDHDGALRVWNVGNGVELPKLQPSSRELDMIYDRIYGQKLRR
jgi:WD40 repeat protein